MTSRPDIPAEDPDDTPRDAKLRRLLAELEELRRAGIFTEVQFEDERRRLLREAEGDEAG